MSTLKDRLTPEEWRAYRNAVNAKYDRTEKGRASTQRANASPKAKERYARYRLTEKYRESQERYHSSPKAAATAAAGLQRQKERTPERVKARAAVAIALKKGTLVRPDLCAACGHLRKLHAHHWAGYDREAWLAVLWLCVPCHRKFHQEPK